MFVKDLDEVDDKMVEEEEQEEEWRGRAESYELDSFVCVTGYLSGIDILLFNVSFFYFVTFIQVNDKHNGLDVASFVNSDQIGSGNFLAVLILRRIRTLKFF